MTKLLATCKFCSAVPGTKVGPPALARCITPSCEASKLGAETHEEWNARNAMTSPSDTIRNAALKRNTVFVFDDGVLTIKQSGHGKADGWAELAFHEEQVEVDADGYHKVEIPPSELTELRDFLVRNLPASPGEPVAYRWRTRNGISNDWKLVDKFSPSLMENCIEFGPLYTAPQRPDEIAWLVEKGDDPPEYVTAKTDWDDHWTRDANEALRFARKQDADSYIDHYSWTRPYVRAVEHMWPAPPSFENTAPPKSGDGK